LLFDKQLFVLPDVRGSKSVIAIENAFERIECSFRLTGSDAQENEKQYDLSCAVDTVQRISRPGPGNSSLPHVNPRFS